jgi:hypothetical protein
MPLPQHQQSVYGDAACPATRFHRQPWQLRAQPFERLDDGLERARLERAVYDVDRLRAVEIWLRRCGLKMRTCAPQADGALCQRIATACQAMLHLG